MITEDVKPSEVLDDVPAVVKPAPRKRLQKIGAKSPVPSPPSSPEIVAAPDPDEAPARIKGNQPSPLNRKTEALTAKQIMQAAEAEAAAWPARAGRRKVQYIISDSSSDDTNEDSDVVVSDF